MFSRFVSSPLSNNILLRQIGRSFFSSEKMKKRRTEKNEIGRMENYDAENIAEIKW